jgi:amidase
VSFWAGSVGTQTSGSLLIPSNNNMLVGIDPTIGRLSRHGIIPITMDQDSAGPMTRSVAGAAILLGAMESAASSDPNDPAVGTCNPPANRDYTAFLDKEGLKGARIGIPRAYYYEPVTPPGEDQPRGGLSDEARALMDEAIAVLKSQGAIIVDPAVIPSHVATDPDDSQLLFGNCYDTQVRGKDENCSVVMKYGMKRDFNAWLESLGDSAPLASLAELRAFNEANPQRDAIRYAQQELDFSDEMDVERDRERYAADRAKDLRLTRTQGIDAALGKDNLDALLIPSWAGEQLADKAGYPQIIVPYGTVPLQTDPPLPAGFDPAPLPFGVAFMGTACSEPRLIELAYAFEQATRRRVAPSRFP